MFEHETETIIDAVRERVFRGTTGGDLVAIKDLLASDIPHPIKTFFRADIEAMLLHELNHHRKTSRFDFDHPEVRSLQQQMNSILVLNYTFKRLEFQQRLRDAVHMIINYLVRPQWTLAGVVFENTETMSSPALIGMLRYFGAYEYMKNIIVQYVQDKQITSFTRKEFVTLVRRVDGEYVKRKAGDELARVLSPMYDFFDFPRNTSSNAIPIRALVKFFEDKGLTSVLPSLEGEVVQEKTELTRQELGELLEGVRRTSGAFEVEKADVEHLPAPSPISPTSIPLAASHQTTPAATESVSTTAALQPNSDLESIASEHDRKRFVKKIFKQDEEAYRATIRTLGGMSTWREASKFIDELFIENDIDPYTSEAERFIELIFQYYYPKK